MPIFKEKLPSMDKKLDYIYLCALIDSKIGHRNSMHAYSSWNTFSTKRLRDDKAVVFIFCVKHVLRISR